jgi:hypothetical protein
MPLRRLARSPEPPKIFFTLDWFTAGLTGRGEQRAASKRSNLVSLQAKLDAFKADFEAGKPPYNVPYSVIETMRRATAELRASGAAERGKKVRDEAPAFTLKDPWWRRRWALVAA